ncbi:methyltransferase [Curtobacterium sp. MCPF17_052]|uniref:methyltransferase n=1 Tax=Curtobacterium sp. MCPF17_052 TaxID=2175655 RepID=UPI0034639DBC
MFVPRARTRVVVTEAARRLHRYDRVVDLCCGAGAIGMALLERIGALDLVASDIDPDATDVAAENLGDRGDRRDG